METKLALIKGVSVSLEKKKKKKKIKHQNHKTG